MPPPYKYVKEIDKQYANELSKPDPGDRERNFNGLEKDLQTLIAESNRLRGMRGQQQVASNLPAVGRVKALANFHMQQQSNVTGLDRTNAVIIYYRQWLFRQGAKLTPDGKIIWRRSHAKVVWDKDLAQGFTKISVKGGVFYQADGKVFDTKNMVTAAMGPGWAIYVMSQEGNIHVSSHSVGHRHHSSLLAGAPVAGAGEMKVSQGRLMVISNKSGHYMPEPYYLLQVMDRLLADGVSMQTQVMAWKAEPPPTLYPNYEAFRRVTAFPPDPEDLPILVYDPNADDEPPKPEFVSVPGYPVPKAY